MRELARRRVEQAHRRRFERLVGRALDDLPPEIAAMLDNVEVVVEDEPTPEQIGRRGGDQETLFGLYEGVPRTERGSGYSLVLPDKVTIFRGPLERACRSPAEVAREVRITVIHELGHHLGFEEDRLEQLGLG
jgi:predicted Zn-dependent protease with MMP-like domain